ncbi:GNAT family N-acetyltransferase [Thermovibrio ammonificans]
MFKLWESFLRWLTANFEESPKEPTVNIIVINEDVALMNQFRKLFLREFCRFAGNFPPCRKPSIERETEVRKYLSEVIVPFHHIWGVVKEGRLIGFAAVMKNGKNSGGTHKISHIFVEEEGEGRITESLVKLCKEFYKKLYIELPADSHLVNLLKRLGFKEVKREKREGGTVVALSFHR